MRTCVYNWKPHAACLLFGFHLLCALEIEYISTQISDALDSTAELIAGASLGIYFSFVSLQMLD